MKTIKTTVALATILSIVPSFLAAQGEKFSEQDYYTVLDSAVTLTDSEAGGDAVPPELPIRNGSKGAESGLANAGLAAWGVITSGAPSAGYASAYASAIPGFSFNWGNIAGWKGPKEMVYQYKVTNLMGVDVINVKYKISFFYGGTEDYSGKSDPRMNDYVAQATGQSGKKDDKIHGRYITNFTVQPVSVNVKWGWKFDLTVRMSDPMNVGTKMNPVAALQASLNWIRTTPFSTNGGTLTYNVDGLGNFRDLNKEEMIMNGEAAPQQISKTPAISWDSK